MGTTLYKHRFGPYFVSPLVAALEKKDGKWKPVVCNYDTIGCINEPDDFVVEGTAIEMLYGACETFYKPNLEAEELFKVASNCLLSSLNRDILSGWGAKVYILTPDGLTIRTIKTRMD